MKYRRSPTFVQVAMIALMVIALAALIGWSIPELAGVFSEEVEDTYSEWVWDLPVAGLAAVCLLHLIVAGLAGWSVWHFIEGWLRRRADEQQESPPGS